MPDIVTGLDLLSAQETVAFECSKNECEGRPLLQGKVRERAPSSLTMQYTSGLGRFTWSSSVRKERYILENQVRCPCGRTYGTIVALLDDASKELKVFGLDLVTRTTQ